MWESTSTAVSILSLHHKSQVCSAETYTATSQGYAQYPVDSVTTSSSRLRNAYTICIPLWTLVLIVTLDVAKNHIIV